MTHHGVPLANRTTLTKAISAMIFLFMWRMYCVWDLDTRRGLMLYPSFDTHNHANKIKGPVYPYRERQNLMST
jgi:hypothetical protein